MDRLDLRDQGPILGRPWALRPPQPVVEAAGRGVQHPTHQAYWEVFAMISDELQLHFCVAEKMVTAFLRNISGSRFLWPQMGRRPARVF
jgi:hypothetical protein